MSHPPDKDKKYEKEQLLLDLNQLNQIPDDESLFSATSGYTNNFNSQNLQNSQENNVFGGDSLGNNGLEFGENRLVGEILESDYIEGLREKNNLLGGNSNPHYENDEEMHWPSSARELNLNVISARSRTQAQNQNEITINEDVNRDSLLSNPFSEMRGSIGSQGSQRSSRFERQNLIGEKYRESLLSDPFSPSSNPFETPVGDALPNFDAGLNQFRSHEEHHKQVDSDTISDTSDDSEDLFNVNKMLKSRRNLSSSLTPFMSKLLNKVEIGTHDEYEDLFSEENIQKDEELKMEAIIIRDSEQKNIEKEKNEIEQIQKKMKTQEQIEIEAHETLEDLRNLERHTRENVAINHVKKMQSVLNREEYLNDQLRRRAYKELSDSARHFFKKKEDLIKLKLERKKAFMLPSRGNIHVHKKQWTLEWDKEPQLLDVRICQVRGIGNALPEGHYCLLMSLWNRIGGYPLQFSKNKTKVKKSTSKIYHGGQFDDVSTVIDEVLRINGPSVVQITPRMVFVFELHCFSRGKGDQLISINKTVAWGIFPAVENNLKLIQGCFKCPLIKGEIDTTIDKYDQMQKIIRKKTKYWMGNLYFEVRHSGVDLRVRNPEEYVLEVKHANQEKKEENEILQSQDIENIEKKPLHYRSLFSKLKDKLSNPNSTKEASEYFKTTKRTQILTMEQQKVWFGDPEFSVLKPIHKESDSETETHSETELSSQTNDDDDDLMNIENTNIQNEKEMNAPLISDSQRLSIRQQQQLNIYGSSGASGVFGTSGPSVPSSVRSNFIANPSFRMSQGTGLYRTVGMSQRNLLSSRASSHAKGLLHSQSSRLSLRSSKSHRSIFDHQEEVSEEESSNPELFGKDDRMFLFGEGIDTFRDQDSQRQASFINQTGRNDEPQHPIASIRGAPNESEVNIPIQKDGSFAERLLKKMDLGGQKKTKKNVQLINGSLFKDIFELGGATRMDLNFYKQSVWRKKHTWGGTPIYWEKLVYLRRSVLIDLALHNIWSLEFYLMLIFIFLILVLRAYPHYLGHWIFLSFMRIPIESSSASNFYHMAFSFRGEFRTSAVNFGYAVSGLLFNIFLSLAMFVFTLFAQFLFSQLPTIIYRFVFLYGVATLLDPFLIGIVGAAFRDWDTDMFRLAGYFLITERSSVPGVLITIALYVPLLIIQCVLIYQYTLRVHMNRRILDVYKRLHTREKDLIMPHDLEITYKEFKHIVETSKKWRDDGGHTRFITISRIPLDMTDSILLKRLDCLLMAKRWPSDYIKEVMELERDLHGEETTIHIPVEILASKTRPAVFLKENHFGKIFSISNFPILVDALLFDKYRSKDKKWRLLRIEKLLVEYRIVGRGLIKRLRDGKLITGHIMNPNLARADYEIFSLRDVEVSIPKVKPLSGIQGLYKRSKAQLVKLYHFIYKKVSRTVFKTEDDMKTFDDIQEDELVKERFSKFANTKKICLHVQIYNQSLTREKTLYRHFIRCPQGSICEVFDKEDNQESCSIADVNSNDYWIRRARIEAEWRASIQARMAVQ